MVTAMTLLQVRAYFSQRMRGGEARGVLGLICRSTSFVANL